MKQNRRERLERKEEEEGMELEKQVGREGRTMIRKEGIMKRRNRCLKYSK